MKPSENRAERNKERILRAALELFQVHGIKKTTTNDVSQKAGVSPATVYNHFGSKEELVRAAVKYFLSITMEDFRKIFEGALSFPEKLWQIISYKSDMMGQYQGDFMKMVISEDPEILNYVNSVYMTEIMPMVTDFYDEGKRQGYINPELSTETIMLYFDVMRKGMSSSGLSDNPDQNLKMLQEMTSLFLYGLMGRPEDSRRRQGQE